MDKENKVSVIEIVLIVAGCLLYYFSHSADFFELFGGMIGMLLGAIFFGYIPYSLLKNKIENAKMKVFSVAYFLVNLLVFMASQSVTF